MEINWLLLSVIVILVACICHGYKVGMMHMVFSVATFLVTIVLVRLLAPVGAQMLKGNENVYQAIRQPIEELLEENVDGTLRTEEVLEDIHVSGDVKENILQAAEGIGISEIDVFTPQVKGIAADCITLKVIDLIVYVTLFVIINVGLRVLCFLLDYFSKLPLIKDVNKLAGCGLGLIQGVVVVWLFFVFVTIFAATAWGSWCFERIADSSILSALYTYNLFLVFV